VCSAIKWVLVLIKITAKCVGSNILRDVTLDMKRETSAVRSQVNGEFLNKASSRTFYGNHQAKPHLSVLRDKLNCL
jgi:hypothetical protein